MFFMFFYLQINVFNIYGTYRYSDSSQTTPTQGCWVVLLAINPNSNPNPNPNPNRRY